MVSSLGPGVKGLWAGGAGGSLPASHKPWGSGTLCGQRYTLRCHPKRARPKFCYIGSGMGTGTEVSPEPQGTARRFVSVPVHGARTGLGTGVPDPQVRRGRSGPSSRQRRGAAGSGRAAALLGA